VAPIILIYLTTCSVCTRVLRADQNNSEIMYKQLTSYVFSWHGVRTHPTHLVCLRHWLSLVHARHGVMNKTRSDLRSKTSVPGMVLLPGEYNKNRLLSVDGEELWIMISNT